MKKLFSTSFLIAICGSVCALDDAALEAKFRDGVQPFLQTYCVSCHSGAKAKGDFDLSPYSTVAAVAKNFKQWETVLEKIQSGEMPPPKAKLHPDEAKRKEIVAWILALRKSEARRNAGDPGPVYARRLNNTEYDYTIRDLTGVDIRPAKEFPIDPANEAGFDNSSESLAMSPALVKKYLEAARLVADHLVLKPHTLAFAPHRVVTDTDCDKYCTNRILAFYKRQRTDIADYLFAAWRIKNSKTLSLEGVAREERLSAKYLASIVTMLNEKPGELGPIVAVQKWWAALPVADGKNADEVKAECAKIRDFIVGLRTKLVPEVKNLNVQGIINSAQAFVLWKDREYAANRRKYAGGALKLKDVKAPENADSAKAMEIPADEEAAKKYEATFERFCNLFPDAFLVSQRARVFMDDEKEKKNSAFRPLSAGFHTQMGFFRDDGPLYDMMLDDAQKKELDDYWQELDFIANVPSRQYQGFLWFERTDSRFLRDEQFDFARAEDKDATSPPKMKKLEELYLAKATKNGASPKAVEAIKDYFKEMWTRARWVEQARLAAEPEHLVAMKEIAARAYRRPLSASEGEEIVAFYRSLRKSDGLSHEDALRDTLVSVLMSPHFCYRLDLPQRGATNDNKGVAPLSDYALASRLSYFLWSSMPDKELMNAAASGELHKPDVIVAQAKRMLKDEKIRGLAIQFGGNWLDYRRFEEHNSVDRNKFPVFTNDLRQAMFEEPVQLLTDALRNDRSALDLIYGSYTFVNAPLAKHYGMPELKGKAWVKVDDAEKYGRGGLLPMAVFLTKNAPGLRTSPVKRGYWVVRRVLGEKIPPPPPKVPELPSDESKLEGMSLREALAHHREDPSCAACHARFDAMGLVFEGYGPVGERREKDLGGRLVDARANFPDKTDGAGLDGLREYLKRSRQNDYLENLCREMFSYALGRTLLLSDDDTIGGMRQRMNANDQRLGVLVEAIVTSPQFFE